jgi:hypothetical protein
MERNAMTLDDEIIDDYLSGSLSSRKRSELESLLQRDASARTRVEEARLLSAMLRSSVPDVPTARIWSAIHSEISPGQAKRPGILELIEGFFSSPALRWGLGSVAALLFIGIGLQVLRQRPQFSTPQASETGQLPQRAKSSSATLAQAPAAKRQPAVPSVPALAKKSAPAPASAEATEVERALRDQDPGNLQDREVNAMVAMLLEQRRRSASGLSLAPQAAPGAAARAFARVAPSAGTSNVGYESQAPAAAMAEAPAAQALRGGLDSDGFWNFRPAALALNRHDWNTAAAELQAAKASAPEASERAFAASALKLLSQPGLPLEDREAPADSTGPLVVQSAGSWQYYVDRRLARYSRGVSARMPGLRSQGSDLVLDLAFDRASFSPGTHFVRLAGDEPASVQDTEGSLDAQKSEFDAPRGADYVLQSGKLRLK